MIKKKLQQDGWNTSLSCMMYDHNREEMPQFTVTSGESIMKEEVTKALKAMKNGKAPGPDELSTEALKALD